MSFKSDFDKLWLAINDEVPPPNEQVVYEIARMWYNTGRLNLVSDSGSCAICGAELLPGDATRLIHADCYDPEEHEMEVIEGYCSWKRLHTESSEFHTSTEPVKEE